MSILTRRSVSLQWHTLYEPCVSMAEFDNRWMRPEKKSSKRPLSKSAISVTDVFRQFFEIHTLENVPMYKWYEETLSNGIQT